MSMLEVWAVAGIASGMLMTMLVQLPLNGSERHITLLDLRVTTNGLLDGGPAFIALSAAIFAAICVTLGFLNVLVLMWHANNYVKGWKDGDG